MWWLYKQKKEADLNKHFHVKIVFSIVVTVKNQLSHTEGGFHHLYLLI